MRLVLLITVAITVLFAIAAETHLVQTAGAGVSTVGP